MKKIKNYLKSLKIFIGRPEHCPQCNKRLWNRGHNLSYDLYTGEKSVTWCKECSKKNIEIVT